MDDIQVNYGLSRHLPRYTEINSNGEILFQSDSLPAFVSEKYPPMYGGMTPRNEMNFGHKTSDHYRTFDIPDRFENPDWFQDFSKPDENQFYRTSNQDYGRYKPLTHHMPTVYRTKPREFTQTMSIGGNFRNRGFNTSMNDLMLMQSARRMTSTNNGSWNRSSFK